MARVRITVVKKAFYADLAEKYENPATEPCELQVGQQFVSENGEKPQGMCANAWATLAPFVQELARGGGNFYGDWMLNPHSAVLSCNDEVRPVSFLLENG